ncbi:uncharacterized protein Z520_05978 [Fonsecaea multimorphosa CBS 102226]|uniref:Uncharacterized protein n=1 Tax=Fonsecaea multimorphosa CBS 102226 TaxID=1442371 RepID=A0A0D2JYQ7_9EURO|nr:uncharacterized protein Z520_05978 [Fonsecaea multimorphosa CBS 102226]KIX98677.1 hypothetical protein Z520_05978 [Fonsecaea multimorphosa CBS 102226]OAL24862.1 hypothetical protein AYO22_05651 [Fonsecaea multimorphosa]
MAKAFCSTSSLSLEKAGVYIGGGSFREVLTPRKKDGQTQLQRGPHPEWATVFTLDWTPEEEKRLGFANSAFALRSLRGTIYFLAYMDRANLGDLKILGLGTSSSIEGALGM